VGSIPPRDTNNFNRLILKSVTGAKPVAVGVRGLGPAADEVGEVWHDGLALDGETGAEEVPEGDAELGTGLQQGEECIAAVAACRTVGAAADLALDHLAADVALRP
jgi:hypothetical protein